MSEDKLPDDLVEGFQRFLDGFTSFANKGHEEQIMEMLDKFRLDRAEGKSWDEVKESSEQALGSAWMVLARLVGPALATQTLVSMTVDLMEIILKSEEKNANA